VTGELAGALRQAGEEGGPADSRVTPEALASLIALVRARTVSHGVAKQVLSRVVAEGGDPAVVVEREGLAQISDAGELEAVVERALEAEPEAAEQVRSGNPKAIGRIVGAVMKETQGRADGGEVTRLIRQKLGV
jgi:aspartyl-tRNA(Asn)/glutamyl-tRNA(Gln) amidotransferase subunit B